MSAIEDGGEARLWVPTTLLIPLTDAIARASSRFSARAPGRRALDELAARLRGRSRMLDEQPRIPRPSAASRAAAALNDAIAAVEPLCASTAPSTPTAAATATLLVNAPQLSVPVAAPVPEEVAGTPLDDDRPLQPLSSNGLAIEDALYVHHRERASDPIETAEASLTATSESPAVGDDTVVTEAIEPPRDGPITEGVLRGRRGITAATIENLVHFQPATVVEALEIYGVGRRVTALLLELGLITDPDGAQAAAA